MAKTYSFTLRFSPEERRMVTLLAERLERSESDTLRLLVRVAYQRMSASPPPAGAPAGGRP
jgi:hypothetical protein